MLANTYAKATANRIFRLNKTIMLCLYADQFCARAEKVVSSIKWKDGQDKLASVDFYPDWGRPTVAVTVWYSDPADVVENVCGPLFQEFKKPWVMSTWDDFKAFYTATIDDKERIDLVVQILSPQGCEVVEVTETVKRLKCA